MEEPKKYKITTITEIEQIPEDKIDDFLVDLKSFLSLRKKGRELNKLLSKISPESAVKMPDYIMWVDDGKHDIDITFKAKVKAL